MFGPDWLISPVTAQGATSWPVYLPDLARENEEWVYWWNQTVVGGGWKSVDTTKIGHFPLFTRRAKPPASTTAPQ